jgi:hypothetical protein
MKELVTKKTTPGFEIVRPLASLPTELRLQILILATKDYEDILIKPGYLRPVKRLVKAGFDMSEAVNAFVQSNTFQMQSSHHGTVSTLDRLESFLEAHNAFDQVRSVHLDNLKRDLPKLVKQCDGLKRLRIPIDAYTVCSWSEPMYDGGGYSEPEEKVPGFVESLDLQMM